MTRVQHLQAAVLAIVVLLGGELFFTVPGKYSLRGTGDTYAEMLQKQANDTLDSFMKTVNEQSLKKEELVSVVERLKGIEKKLQEPQDDIPKKKDIIDLQEKVSSLDGKIKAHEGTSVEGKDLEALEERLSSFENKVKNKNVNDNDLVTLKQRMSSYENKLKEHQDGIMKKEDLDALEGLISSLESNIHGLNNTVSVDGADAVVDDATTNDSAQSVTKGSVAKNDVSSEKTIAKNKTTKVKASEKPSEISAKKTSNSVEAPTLSTQQQVLLNTFNPKNAPIMGRMTPSIDNPVRTRLLLLSPKKYKVRAARTGPMKYVSDEVFNIALDGLERSPYFESLEPTILRDHRYDEGFVIKEDDDVVWVVDSRNLAPTMYRKEYNVDEEVLVAAKATVNYQKSLSGTKQPSLRVVFIDYRDKTAGNTWNCGPERKALIKLLGEGNVRQVVGKIAVGRQWNSDKKWVEPGNVWNNKDYTCSGTPTIRSPYAVRSDYVEAVDRLFRNYLGSNIRNLKPFDTIRPLDVAHFWDPEPVAGREKEYRLHAELRTAVSEVVSSLNGTMAGSRRISARGGTVSEGEGHAGRTEVSEDYLKSLLTTKIVVVAQRDIWEDHYRLFEAFTGGAMVMTDPMLKLPAGLIDGENIVVYRSLDDLRELLLYYLHPEQDKVRLQIARKGFKVAMSQHRSFHQMEELFFGKALSPSTLSPVPAKDGTHEIDSAASVGTNAQSSPTSKLTQSKKFNQDSVSVKAAETGANTAGNKRTDKAPVLTKNERALLETFNPEHAPILGNRRADSNNPARVRVLQMSPKKRKMRVRESQTLGGKLGLLGDEMINIVLDGFEKSPFFESLESTVIPDHKSEPDFILEEPEDVIWVVDSRNLTYSTYHYSVDEDVLIAAKATVKYQQSLDTDKKPSLSVVFVDFRDKLAGRAALCDPEREELVKLLGEGNVRHVVGKVVTGRKWNKDNNWTEPGTIWENTDYECFKRPTLHAPYTVRSDYAAGVEQLFLSYVDQTKHDKSKQLTPVDTFRPLDVAHYWDMERAEGHENEYRYYSHLRNAVSEVVASLDGTKLGKRKLDVLAGTVSAGGSTGRTEVSEAYLKSLLTTKIVVVAQRDTWEDHYRLFEAFTGGAMVFTDLMLSLPAGLIDGENVVVYRSVDDLREQLLYYLHPDQEEARLKIARKGYEVAMGQHRSYHRMEEIFYGKRLSPSTLPSSYTKEIGSSSIKPVKKSTSVTKKRAKKAVSVKPGKSIVMGQGK